MLVFFHYSQYSNNIYGFVVLDNGIVTYSNDETCDLRNFCIDTYGKGKSRKVINDDYGYLIQTQSYIPVITISGGNLVTDPNKLTQNYKNKYTSCNYEDRKFGTKECPYLIDFGDYYSDGTKK